MTSSATIPPASTPGHPSYHKKDAAQCTAGDLKSYDPLTYEVLMVHALARRAAELKEPGAPLLDQLTENMLVESFALHFRNLVTFLWPSAPHAKDVYATHFTVSKPGTWAGPTTAKPSDQLNRASREVAHLTTHRLPSKLSLKHWNMARCIDQLLPALEEFVQHADSAKLPSGLAQEVRALKVVTTNTSVMTTLRTANFSTTAETIVRWVYS